MGHSMMHVIVRLWAVWVGLYPRTETVFAPRESGVRRHEV